LRAGITRQGVCTHLDEAGGLRSADLLSDAGVECAQPGNPHPVCNLHLKPRRCSSQSTPSILPGCHLSVTLQVCTSPCQLVMRIMCSTAAEVPPSCPPLPSIADAEAEAPDPRCGGAGAAAPPRGGPRGPQAQPGVTDFLPQGPTSCLLAPIPYTSPSTRPALLQHSIQTPSSHRNQVPLLLAALYPCSGPCMAG
jgi:hypothetical protein